ncbi:hypothetical protein [Enterococcus malodoratus]|uniref:Uncharacterized protein n=1 Tax=Enterococcus malodoratus ATCC 43197 TaxID=1158601 RepID=R2NN30_9ENTE|nr:hypothetical protein [Enterococcus malodoratus]EOH73422.1 hypothetical protein UAI_03613 [Enterococcus malodoratus ATCC 43197]EOT67275.1 hypothetical protein I585_02796 [Enterococcus malodoratus ATCC 43197]OJG57979.1 hypothetical protein RV07_GL003201 [Enterococcus malodoratus]SPX03268.1 Uncharacterised protein [Enterococcus malodoratus]STD69473.1 Uncharacterised protein [Enterococcus malodoratus]
MAEKNDIAKSDKLIISNPIGGELIMKRLSASQKGKKFKEVFVSEASLLAGNITQGALQVANQAMTVAQIAKQAPNGLFTASVDPAKLSKFKNGTLTTMVHGGEKKLEHFGFTEVAISGAINPAMVLSAGMQVMSMISGTYYLNQINSQIRQIDEKLDELIQFHHDESIGKLKAARRGLSEIAVREIVDMADVNEIRNYKKTSQEIQEEYLYRLNRDVHNFVPDKKGDKKKLDNLNFQMSIAFEASKLSLFTELIELGTRMKIGGQSELIEGLTTQLKNNYKNSLYLNIDYAADNYYKIIKSKYQTEKSIKQKNNNKIEKVVNFVPVWGWGVLGKTVLQGTVSIKKNIDISTSNKKEVKRRESLDSLIYDAHENKKIETIDVTIDEMLQLPYEGKDILYVVDGNRQRVFVPEE